MFPALKKFILWIALTLLWAFAPRAQAAVPFTFYIGGGPNVPWIELVNESRSEITRLEISIGNYDKNFDFARDFFGYGVGGVLEGLDGVDDGSRSDRLIVNFTDFRPGQWFGMYEIGRAHV